MKFKLGELYCGPGGLAYGATNAKIDNNDFKIVHEWASDYDPDTCATYVHNICPEHPESVLCVDVRKLNINTLSPIDALAFGFPCNTFSLVGEQKGIEDESFGPLYTYGVKVLKKHKPMFFLAENVGGIRSANEGSALGIIFGDLKKAGYRIYPHLYKFEQYGVPQARHRVIIIGIRKDLPYEYRVPSPTLYNDIDVSARTALEKPPIPVDAKNNELTKQSAKVVERLKYIKPGQNAFNADLPEELKLNVKGAKISQIYKRLDPDKPSYTVTGSGGGGTHIYHYSEPRALTNRERARLQSFPDTYEFIGNKEAVRRQIGMAVPSKGAQLIFEAVLKTFAGIPYESIPCNLSE
jgi:DNA (cytosine-5)-methyltransferase 1